MNQTLKSLALGVFLSGSLVFSMAARAEENDKPTVIPDTTVAIWQAVDKETEEMSKMVTT